MKPFALLTALALSACVASADETALAPDFSKMDWILTEVDGKTTDWTATINLAEARENGSGQISGQAPCNRYFGPVTRDGDSFRPGALASTQMACLHMTGEAEFFAILGGITKAEQGPGTLILSGGGHEMRFVQPID